MEAVRRGCPGAKVANKGSNGYPVQVTVSAVLPDGTKRPLWRNAQRNLFMKYFTKRAQSQKEIAQAVKDFAAGKL